MKHETRILLLTLASGAGSLVLALWLLWLRVEMAAVVKAVISASLVLLWVGLGMAVRERVMRPLQTASNLLSALREEDFSVRARSARHDDALGELMGEINFLSQTLREQRLGALEASHLLRAVMAEIDVAIFTFDEPGRLQLVNRAGEKLLGRSHEQLLQRTAEELGLAEHLTGEPVRTVQVSFPGATGRWGVRRNSFRQDGRPHQLLVMTDLSRALRDEERQAWQRIVRVIGHELNNSLAPIKSISGTMGQLLARTPRPDDWEGDLQNGLSIIASRADSLARFLSAYSRLARLPPPRRQEVRVNSWIGRVISLETRIPVQVDPGPDITIQADGDQLEQLLINLVRNAADAVLETGAGEGQRVQVTWRQTADTLEVRVEDDGPGLSGSANLFVPFYTTKPGGSGIGLALSRQIAEAHGGTLTLDDRLEWPGCVARLNLPLNPT